jgi:hypothetical protein
VSSAEDETASAQEHGLAHPFKQRGIRIRKAVLDKTPSEQLKAPDVIPSFFIFDNA